MIGKYTTELIGTFFLVFIIALAVQMENAEMLAPLAIGCGLTMLVYLGGHISGAHYNPAVTVAVFLRGKCSIFDVVPYMACQLAGAIGATFTAFWLVGEPMLLPAPGADVPLIKAVVSEGIFTFLLVVVILNVATSPKTEGNSYYGLAIGFTVLTAAYVAGGISGGAYNPAVGMGPIIANMLSGTEASITHFWIYLVGPFSGGIVGAIAYHLQHFGEFGLTKSAK